MKKLITTVLLFYISVIPAQSVERTGNDLLQEYLEWKKCMNMAHLSLALHIRRENVLPIYNALLILCIFKKDIALAGRFIHKEQGLLLNI